MKPGGITKPTEEGPPPPPKLPPGWRSAKDADGNEYYYNKKLGVTQWEKPVVQNPEDSVVPPPPPPKSQPSPAAAAASETSGVSRRDHDDPGTKGTTEALPSSSTAASVSSGAVSNSFSQGGGGGGGADNEMIFQCLVDGLEAQKERLVARTVERYNAGDKMAALSLNIEKKHVVKTLEWVQEQRTLGKPAPAHRIAKRRIQQPALDASIPNDKLIVAIESANDLPVPGGKGATYIKVVLGFPKDSPTEQRTPLSSELRPKAADDASPSFKSTLQFELKRTKELLRYAERRRVKLSVEAHCETKVLFLHKKTIFIGRAEMDLSDLLTAKEIPSTTLTLVDEKSKKPSGGSVTVSACVRQPWNGQKVSIEMVEDVIILDDKKSPAPPQSVAAEYLRLIKDAGEAPVLSSQSSSATASAGAGVSARPAPQQQQGKTAPKAAGPSGKAAVQMDKLYREAKIKFDRSIVRSGMSESDKQDCAKYIEEAYKGFVQILQLNNGADYRNTNDYISNCKKIIAMKKQGGRQVEYNSISKDEEPAKAQGSGGGEEEEVVLGEWDSVQRMRSDEVFTLEKGYCERMMKETEGTDAETEWEIRLEEVNNAQFSLGSMIEAGVVTPESYAKKVKAAMKRDVTLAKMMQEQGKLTEKARLVSWARAMQTELKAIAEYAGDSNESAEGEAPQPLVDVPKRGGSVSNHPVVPAVGEASAAGAAASLADVGAPAKVAKKATSAPGGGTAGGEGWGEGTSDVDGIQSYEVVQWEIQYADKMIKGSLGSLREAWEVRREALQLRGEELETSIQYGMITEEAYLASLKQAIQQSMSQLPGLRTNAPHAAGRLAEWIRIMQEEAGLEGEEAPQQAAAAAAPIPQVQQVCPAPVQNKPSPPAYTAPPPAYVAVPTLPKQPAAAPPAKASTAPADGDEDLREMTIEDLEAELEAQEAQKWDRVSGICSCKVLQVEMDLCERMMKQLTGKPGQEEWADRKEEVEFRMQELAGELEYGVISAKDYLKEIQEAIRRGTKKAAEFQKQGRMAEAQRLFQWLKVMAEEIKSGGR